MTKKLKWRLGKLPSPDEVRELVKDKIITQEEARDILFSSETEDTRDKESLEEEIRFLRKLVEKLSSGQTTRIVETIREVERPWRTYPWYGSYNVWCSSKYNQSGLVNANYVTGNADTLQGTKSINSQSVGIGSNISFSDIKTF